MKREKNLKITKSAWEKNKTIMNFQQMFRKEAHNVFTEKVNKIALSANDHKVMQTNAILIDSSHIYMAQDLV